MCLGEISRAPTEGALVFEVRSASARSNNTAASQGACQLANGRRDATVELYHRGFPASGGAGSGVRIGHGGRSSGAQEDSGNVTASNRPGMIHDSPHHATVPGSVTVVIITRDRCDSLERTLQHITTLPELREVIVVDNGTHTCSIAETCRRYDRVRLISLDHNCGPAARNLGVDAATTSYVAFCDDDSWWEQEALSRARSYFERYPHVGLIAGKVLVGPDERLDPVSTLQANSPLPVLSPMPGPAILGFLACAAMVRVEAFRAVGGYSTLLGVGGEETLLAIDLSAAGWGLTYAGDLVAHHYPSPHRSIDARRRAETRNALRIAWMRRPWRSAFRITVDRYAAIQQPRCVRERSMRFALAVRP